MCIPPLAMAAIGAAQSALQISSVNSSLEAQGESVAKSAELSYIERQFETRQQQEAALERGYADEITKRQAIGAAQVRNAALGIRGTTAGELVASEKQIGNFNVQSSKDDYRKAGAAYKVGTDMTKNRADDEIGALEAQAPTVFESMVSIAAGGLSGYLSGAQMQDVMDTSSGPPSFS